MYEAYYGFREKPFNLTPDPKYLYLSAKHSEAFAHLEFGLRERGGFVVITGEVGTGKTTLCRYFLERLDENTKSAFILYPALTAVELLQAVCGDLGIEEKGWTAKEWVDILHRFLLKSRADDKNIVLVVDEAQNLDSKVLEQIRLISNLETTTEKLIQIVLTGQTELSNLLAQDDLRQLAQRVTARYHLGALNREETSDYIRHRLGVVGGAGKVAFTPAALKVIHRFSKGIPRLINLVCDRALLAGFVTNRREIDGPIARRAVKELETIPSGARPKSWLSSWRARGAAAALVLAALALAFRYEAQRFFPWSKTPAVENSNELDATPPVSEASEEPEPEPSISGEAFELRLRTLSRRLSKRGATTALLEQWGYSVEDDGASFSPNMSFRNIGRRVGFEVTELTTHLEQLEKLNVPVILELFHTMRNDTCFATLLGLDGRSALLSYGPGDTAPVPIASLERHWNRKAYVFWRDFENLSTPGSDESQARSWVESTLRELGYLPEAGVVSATELRAGLTRFQGTSFLVADGVAGPKTRMALYSLSDRYSMPRLREP
jgi:general secretion pathway protein A